MDGVPCLAIFAVINNYLYNAVIATNGKLLVMNKTLRETSKKVEKKNCFAREFDIECKNHTVLVRPVRISAQQGKKCN